MHTPDAYLIESMENTMPEIPADEMQNWETTHRSVPNTHIVLVRLSPTVADMTRDEFCEAVRESDSTSSFRELVEVHPPRTGGGTDVVYRVTGDVVPDSPRYFRDSLTASIVLHGQFSQDNIGVALYGPETFTDSVYPRLSPYRVFSADTQQNRVSEIRSLNSFTDKLRSESFQTYLQDLVDGTDTTTDEFLDEFGT